MDLEREVVLMALLGVVILVEIISLTLGRLLFSARWADFSSIRLAAHGYATCLGVVKFLVDLSPLQDAVFRQILWETWWLNLPSRAAITMGDVVNYAPYVGIVAIYLLYAFFQVRYSHYHPAALNSWIRDEFRQIGNSIVIGLVILTLLAAATLFLSPHSSEEQIKAKGIFVITVVGLFLAALVRLQQGPKFSKAAVVPTKERTPIRVEPSQEPAKPLDSPPTFQQSGVFDFVIEYVSYLKFRNFNNAYLLICTGPPGQPYDGEVVLVFLDENDVYRFKQGSIVRIKNPRISLDEDLGTYEATLTKSSWVSVAKTSGEASV